MVGRNGGCKPHSGLPCSRRMLDQMPGCILLNSRGGMEVYCRVEEYKNHLCIHAQAFVTATVKIKTKVQSRVVSLAAVRAKRPALFANHERKVR